MFLGQLDDNRTVAIRSHVLGSSRIVHMWPVIPTAVAALDGGRNYPLQSVANRAVISTI